MSLLRANGHPLAELYPVGRVWDECQLVEERENARFANLGILIQAATATTGMTAGREAGNHFKKLIKSLSGLIGK